MLCCVAGEAGVGARVGRGEETANGSSLGGDGDNDDDDDDDTSTAAAPAADDDDDDEEEDEGDERSMGCRGVAVAGRAG
jgi:hypothetical protein